MPMKGKGMAKRNRTTKKARRIASEREIKRLAEAEVALARQAKEASDAAAEAKRKADALRAAVKPGFLRRIFGY